MGIDRAGVRPGWCMTRCSARAPLDPDRAALVAVLALCAALSGCGPGEYRDYEKSAAQTAKSVASQVRTADLAAQAAARRRAATPYLKVVIGQSEQTADQLRSKFEAAQPPDERSDRLREELSALLAQASDSLGALRIAVRRGQVERLPRIAEPLPGLAERLSRFEEAHR